jgi:hypothetical protein
VVSYLDFARNRGRLLKQEQDLQKKE